MFDFFRLAPIIVAICLDGVKHDDGGLKNALCTMVERSVHFEREPRQGPLSFLRLLPLRDRSLLMLAYGRGAKVSEIAGLLGLPKKQVRRLVRSARRRASDRGLVALASVWRRLEPHERRLVYLHRVLGMPLRAIARMRLVDVPSERGQAERAGSRLVLRRVIARIEGKARKLVASRSDDGPSAGQSAG